MADSSGAPRRVSVAYILGFSNKPFKDGGPPAPPPAPRHPSAFKQMVTTPGGVIEWAASDGRRGRLTGPGKPRLTAANLAQVPKGKASVKTASKKDVTEENDGGLFAGLLGDDAPAAPASAKAADDDKPANSDWTKEQDNKLLELRGESPKGPWDDVAKEIDNGKQGWQCKDRFNQIKPKDWKPNNAKGKQKQGKQKGQKNQKNQKDGEKKDEEKKDGATNGGFDASENNGWGTGAWDNPDTSGNTQDNNGGFDLAAASGWGGDANTSGENKSEKKDDSNGWCGGGWDNSLGNQNGDNKDSNGFDNDTTKGWDTGGCDSGGNGPGGWNTNNSGGAGSGGNGGANGWDTSGGGGGGGGNDAWAVNNISSWDTSNNNNDTSNDKPFKKSSSNKGSSSNKDTKEPSNKDTKGSSNKAASRSGDKHHSSRGSEMPAAAAPREYELQPDSTFSADDLRLIAKILQQDCQMVWNRVSWRFKDKTGRNLHPHVFEEKITGKIEDRGSERGRW